MKKSGQISAINFDHANAETELEFLAHSETTLLNLFNSAVKLGKLELAYMISMAMLSAREDQKLNSPSQSIKPSKKAA